MAKTSTTIYSAAELSQLLSTLEEILDTAPNIEPDYSLRPQIKNIEYWFDDESFENLLKLKTAIFNLCCEGKSRALMLTAFGDIIRACSKAERQSLKPYISSKYAKVPAPVFSEYEKISNKYLKAIASNHGNRCSGINWVGSDATDFSLNNAIDLAITSPPYINAMDYTRCIKLESSWVGTMDEQILASVRQGQLGEPSRRHLLSNEEFILELCTKEFCKIKERDPIRFSTAVAFFEDMQKNLVCVHRSLKPNGQYFLIVGNSSIRGIEIETHKIIAAVAEEVGFSWDHYFNYPIRNHRTSIPRGNNGGKIREEHVIGLSI